MEIKNERALAYSEVYEIINKMGKGLKGGMGLGRMGLGGFWVDLDYGL